MRNIAEKLCYGALGILWIAAAILTLQTVFVASGCNSEQELAHLRANQQSRATKIATKQIIYTKDKRTNLCFAISWGYVGYAADSMVMATVPCDKVKKYLKE